MTRAATKARADRAQAFAAEQVAASPIPLLPLELIDFSPTNPRKRFDEAKLTELAESIKKQGVLQPVLVRRHPSDAERYELVCGERRCRATKMAGLIAIPAAIVDLDDQGVLEAQIIENGQRDDIHPLEEADGYQALHQQHHLSVDDIAAKTGKSRAYVYARMKLCALDETARKAFFDGRLTASTALLVARIPDMKLQQQATKDIAGDDEREPMSARRASDHIQQRFMLLLSEAPFSTAASDLTAAGACTSCPKRTGNQAELFSDVASADVCTDPSCFEEKCEADWKARVANAKDTGQKVIPTAEAKKLFPYEASSQPNSNEYVSLEQLCYDDTKHRTYRQLLGKKLDKAELVLVQHPHSKKSIELLPKKGLTRLLKAAGHDFEAARKKQQEKYRADEKKRQAEYEATRTPEEKAKEKTWELERKVVAKLRDAIADAVIVEVARRDPGDRAIWIAMLRGQVDIAGGEVLEDVLRRRDIKIDDSDDGIEDDELIARVTDGMPDAELRGLVFEVCTPLGQYHPSQNQKAAVRDLVDVGAIEARVRAELGAEPMPEVDVRVADDPNEFDGELEDEDGE